MATFEEILAPHVDIIQAGGYYRCSCLHTYEQVVLVAQPPGTGYQAGELRPSPDQRTIVGALHGQHLAETLLRAGAELPKPDPRAALRLRAAGGKP